MGDEPKQFRLLDDHPVVCWAARSLLGAIAGSVVIVLPQEHLAKGEGLLQTHLRSGWDRIRVTVGGERRQDSVRAGLSEVGDASTVLVHDAARPFASPGLAERVARSASHGRAVVPALAIRDTLKEVDGSRVVKTHARETFVLVQTPQGFPTEVLAEVHEEGGDVDATDDAALCERCGVPVTWIEGEALNRKITDDRDWRWAQEIVTAGWIRWG